MLNINPKCRQTKNSNQVQNNSNTASHICLRRQDHIITQILWIWWNITIWLCIWHVLQKKMLGAYYISIERRRIISAMYLIRTHVQVHMFVAWDWHGTGMGLAHPKMGVDIILHHTGTLWKWQRNYLLFIEIIHNMSTKDTCTGSIITQGEAIQFIEDSNSWPSEASLKQ